MRHSPFVAALLAGTLLATACSSGSDTASSDTLTATTVTSDAVTSTDVTVTTVGTVPDSAAPDTTGSTPDDTVATNAPDVSVPSTDDVDGTQAPGDPLEIEAAVAALGLAADSVPGVAYELDFEEEDEDQGGVPTWQVDVAAADGTKVKVIVSADGATVLAQERDDGDSVDDDDLALLALVQVGAADALTAIAPSFSGRIDEMDLDNEGTDPVWEIEIRRPDDSSFDVVVDAVSGVVLDVDDDRRPDVSATASDLGAFVEFATIEQQIPDIAALSAVVETDNPNSRVILFEDGGQPRYKSVFVKSQSRLKLIEIGSNGVIFDEVI